MNLIKFPLVVLLLAVFDHANSQRSIPKPLHEWDFRKDCPSAGNEQANTYLGIKDRGSTSIKAHGLLLGGASCASNKTDGISIKAPSDCTPFACKAGQYVSIGSLGVWGGSGWSFEAYLKFERIFDGPLQRVFDFSGPGTPPDEQRNNVMLNTDGERTDNGSGIFFSGVKFELWDGTTWHRCVTSQFFFENEWIHVVATVGTVGVEQVYKNGDNVNAVCSDGGALNAVPIAERDVNFIGKSTYFLCDGSYLPYCGAYENFDGNIAYIRIYNKELNAAEVWQLYNARNN